MVDKKKELLQLFSEMESLPKRYAEDAIDNLLDEAQEIKDYYYKAANAPHKQLAVEKEHPSITLKNCMHIIATEPHIPIDYDTFTESVVYKLTKNK